MKVIYYVHGMLCFVMFLIADYMHQMFMFGEIASEEEMFLDDIDDERLDELIKEKLDE